MADTQCDVLVIGGGPAGSTISALLAQRGRDVVLLEKARHPRFQIGDSLLPFDMPLFKRLGVAAEIESIEALYYVYCAADPRRSWAAWRKRGQATREAGIETTAA